MAFRVLAPMVLILLALGCGAPPEPQAAPAPVPVPPPQAAESVAPEPQVATVQIARYAFSPARVTVQKGATLRWVNNDATSHSIKLLGAPGAEIISPGQSYELTLDDPGTYQYSCGIHAKMQGTIIVG